MEKSKSYAEYMAKSGRSDRADLAEGRVVSPTVKTVGVSDGKAAKVTDSRPDSLHSRDADGEIRWKLMDAAVGHFADKGYAATSVREIVGAAGVTAPVLYYYFGSKEGVYLEIMGEALRGFRGVITSAEHGEGTAREKILKLGKGMLALFHADPRIARIVYAVFYGPPQGTPFFDFDEFHNGLVSTVAKLIAEGIGRGEFEPGEEEAQTWAVLGTIHIMMEGELCRPECSGGVDGLERILNIVFRGMARK